MSAFTLFFVRLHSSIFSRRVQRFSSATEEKPTNNQAQDASHTPPEINSQLEELNKTLEEITKQRDDLNVSCCCLKSVKL